MCRVSVIVPVYQVEQYLPRCLDSILAQTFTDYELILVNDGTKDDCPRIMREYAQKDKRIRIVEKENGGLSSARNAGLDIARGEYIAFVDSDDYVADDLLADTVAAAERDRAELVLFNYRIVNEQGEQGPYLSFEDETIRLKEIGFANYFYRYWMPYRHGQEAWCRLYRRDVIEANGLRYAPNKEIFAEDTLFSAMYLMHVQTLTALKKPYVYYVQRGDSLMAMKKPKLAHRLMTLSVRLTEYAAHCGMEAELKDVLPVLCYDKLICKGIRFDPDIEDVYQAMEEYRMDKTMKRLMHSLMGVTALTAYTLKTKKGFMTQIRGRLFAMRWMKGDIRGAVRLVQGRKE